MPVDLADYCRSKRNFSLLICSGGSVLYVIAAGIICVAAGYISVKNSWIIAAGACFSFLLNLIFINLMLFKNSKKPQLNWDSETELSRKLGAVNLVIIVIGVLMLVVFLAALALGPLLNNPAAARNVLIICAATSVIILFLALILNRFAVKAAANNLMKLE